MQLQLIQFWLQGKGKDAVLVESALVGGMMEGEVRYKQVGKACYFISQMVILIPGVSETNLLLLNIHTFYLLIKGLPLFIQKYHCLKYFVFKNQPYLSQSNSYNYKWSRV